MGGDGPRLNAQQRLAREFALRDVRQYLDFTTAKFRHVESLGLARPKTFPGVGWFPITLHVQYS